MLGGIWQFLKDPANLAVFGSIGAVIAAIAAGAWAVFTLFAKKSEKGPSAPQPSTTVTVQTPVVNRDAKDVVAPINERLDKLTAQVARDKGVEIAPLRAVLVNLGAKGVQEVDIPKLLDEAADELIKLRAKLDEFRNVFRALGEREGGTARLEEATSAFREALQENTRAILHLTDP